MSKARRKWLALSSYRKERAHNERQLSRNRRSKMTTPKHIDNVTAPDVSAEIDRVRSKMTELRDAGADRELQRLEDVNQALSWARGDVCASPLDNIARNEGWGITNEGDGGSAG
jgi:hypothetical protein